MLLDHGFSHGCHAGMSRGARVQHGRAALGHGIYEAGVVKRPVRGFGGRRFRTFPSLSASVDLPISAAAGAKVLAVFRIFLEPRSREIQAPSDS
jgi:hypothetical protein